MSEEPEEISPELRQWYRDDEAYDYRYAFDLDENSVVFDVGGYDGYWTTNIVSRYDGYIYLFEPVKEFYELAKCHLDLYPKVQCFQYGISNKTCEHIIYLQKDGSNIFINSEKSEGSETIILKDINEILNELKITKIDLIKINAEGVEYDILESLIQSDSLSVINTYLIQYHEFVENAIERKRKIDEAMRQSHDLVFNYDFIWTKWRKKT